MDGIPFVSEGGWCARDRREKERNEEKAIRNLENTQLGCATCLREAQTAGVNVGLPLYFLC